MPVSSIAPPSLGNLSRYCLASKAARRVGFIQANFVPPASADGVRLHGTASHHPTHQPVRGPTRSPLPQQKTTFWMKTRHCVPAGTQLSWGRLLSAAGGGGGGVGSLEMKAATITPARPNTKRTTTQFFINHRPATSLLSLASDPHSALLQKCYRRSRPISTGALLGLPDWQHCARSKFDGRRVPRCRRIVSVRIAETDETLSTEERR